MNPSDVAAYLKEHPDFFENYADVVADVMIPHPHGGRAISISERQILTLRDRAKQLEAKLSEWETFYNFNRPHEAFKGKVANEELRERL